MIRYDHLLKKLTQNVCLENFDQIKLRYPAFHLKRYLIKQNFLSIFLWLYKPETNFLSQLNFLKLFAANILDNSVRFNTVLFGF